MHALWQWLIAAHFRGGIPDGLLRGALAHVDSCPDCRGCYQRHVEWESVLPDADARVGRRLSRQALVLHARPAIAPLWLGGLSAAAAVAVFTLWIALRPAPPQWQARGGDDERHSRIEALVRAPGAQAFATLGDRLGPGSELAFRVDNREQHRWLLLFLVDSAGQVHNLYPARSDGEALRLDGLPAVAALPDAFSPALPTGDVEVVALFATRAIPAAEVEHALAAAAPAQRRDAIARFGRVQILRARVAAGDDGGAP